MKLTALHSLAQQLSPLRVSTPHLIPLSCHNLVLELPSTSLLTGWPDLTFRKRSTSSSRVASTWGAQDSILCIQLFNHHRPACLFFSLVPPLQFSLSCRGLTASTSLPVIPDTASAGFTSTPLLLCLSLCRCWEGFCAFRHIFPLNLVRCFCQPPRRACAAYSSLHLIIPTLCPLQSRENSSTSLSLQPASLSAGTLPLTPHQLVHLPALYLHQSHCH